MTELFLSRSMQKKLKKIKNFDWIFFLKVSIFTLFCLFLIALGFFVNFMAFISINNFEKNNEEVILSNEKAIINIASTYDNLLDRAKANIELEIDDVTITFEKDSDSNKTVLSSGRTQYSIKDNKVVKINENEKENVDSFLIYLTLIVDIIYIFLSTVLIVWLRELMFL